MAPNGNVDWQAAYNRLHPFLDHYTGSQFIKEIQRFDPSLPDYYDFIDKRRKEDKSTTKKAYFKDILLSYHERIKHKLFEYFISPYEQSHPTEMEEIKKILSGGKVEIDESIFDRITPPLRTKSLQKEIDSEFDIPLYKPNLTQSVPTLLPSVQEVLPTVVILTAISEEYMAVREHLTEIEEIIKNDTHYEKGIFIHNSQRIASIIIRECGARNNVAAQEAERAINLFKPNAIFFVGIAGSRKPHDFGIGDVVIPEKIYSYEGGKVDAATFASRPDSLSMSYTLFEIAKAERRKSDWKSLIKGEVQSNIKAEVGVIASGEKLVEHFDSDLGRILKDHFNDTSAIEMEGFGFAKATSRQGREMNNILIGVIRGISDIIQQPNSPTASSENRRPANAKNLASNTAAAFTFWLILKTYPKLAVK